MKPTSNVDTFQQRKDTFLRRGRFRWPYIKYTSYLAQPNTLASAGFSFSPAKDAPDNVQCFHCGFELTGWEPSDDPFAEHHAHQPTCTYAQLHCQARRAQEGDKVEWIGWPPNSTQKLVEMREDVEMRLATFEFWPHKGREEWNVTAEKLSEAGFYYTPEWPGDDTATCAFCGYALAEWEPEDKPNAEHARRAPDCLFFKLDLDVVPQVQPSPQPRRVSVHASRQPEYDSDSSKRPRLSTNTHEPVEEEGRDEGEHQSEAEGDVGDEEVHHSEVEDKKVRQSETQEVTPAAVPVVPERPPLASPTEMNVDNEANTASQIDTQATTQVDGTAEESGVEEEAWELTEDEEHMTVEEFIRACCDQKISSLQVSAFQMIDDFIERAASTRRRIVDMTW
ncbi:hypothetical protein IW146_004996 [Coemansia sp. RSA 922]|nr:hypothetical protein IW146_004996 [Coemansia sp. RSA 922]